MDGRWRRIWQCSILLMTSPRPLAAVAMTWGRPQRREIAGWVLPLATLWQIAALWPGMRRHFSAGLEFPTVHLLMNASLFLTAFLFWRAVMLFMASVPGNRSLPF